MSGRNARSAWGGKKDEPVDRRRVAVIRRAYAAQILAEDEHVMHIGAGTGYFTVGRRGRVTAFEIEADLAARARRNLRPWPQVRVLHGDALGAPLDPADGP